MRVGTKSLLFGAHQVLLHPLAVLISWWRLYGCPRWWEAICILTHDWGYWGCSTMDGEDGALHPAYGAEIAACLMYYLSGNTVLPRLAQALCAGHSRTYARLKRFEVSRLCAADKLASALWPWWVYLPMARATGELEEYRIQAALHHVRTGQGVSAEATNREWHQWMCERMRKAARGEDVSYKEVER